jgi:hypothetical protein
MALSLKMQSSPKSMMIFMRMMRMKRSWQGFAFFRLGEKSREVLWSKLPLKGKVNKYSHTKRVYQWPKPWDSKEQEG